jgi:hypothetical protein
MDTKQRIVKNPSLMRKLAQVANDSLFDDRIRQKARVFIETGELNSVLKPYVKFNAPVADEENNSNPPEKELQITAYINLKDDGEDDEDDDGENDGENDKGDDGEELQKCSICGYRRKIFFKFHTEDIRSMCINCVKDIICVQPPSNKWPCGLGCGGGNTVMKSEIENIIIEVTHIDSGDIRRVRLCDYPEPAEDADGEIQNDKDDSKKYTTRVLFNEKKNGK